jgi:hypothetical protein
VGQLFRGGVTLVVAHVRILLWDDSTKGQSETGNRKQKMSS